MNTGLAELDEDSYLFDPLGDSNKTKTSIRGIQAIGQGAFLLDLDSPESANRLRTYSAEHPDFLPSHLGSSAAIKTKGYNVIFKFVPCTGNFDPKDANCISDLESSNNLLPGSISSATWLKRTDRRSPNQKVATLKVVCSSPETANHLL
ncbi:hypothetical protein BYT27DRAFT_7080241, partial [Phlegmacium glaucopus]